MDIATKLTDITTRIALWINDKITRLLTWINANKPRVIANSVWLISLGAFILFCANPTYLALLLASAYLFHSINPHLRPRLSPSEICAVSTQILQLVKSFTNLYERWPNWWPPANSTNEIDWEFLGICVGGVIIMTGVKGLEICFSWEQERR